MRSRTLRLKKNKNNLVNQLKKIPKKRLVTTVQVQMLTMILGYHQVFK